MAWWLLVLIAVAVWLAIQFPVAALAGRWLRTASRETAPVADPVRAEDERRAA